jgi:Fe-S cluster assembly protein SufD
MPVEAVARELAPYVEAFERSPQDDVKRAAFERFLDAGFPTSHDEDWKFTSLNPLTRTSFDLADPGYEADIAESGLLKGLPAHAARLVFVNGFLAPFLSSGGERTGSLTDAQPRLADAAKTFTALNTAFFSEGALVRVPAKTALPQPIYLIHLSVPGERVTFSNPRNLIVVEAGAQAAIVECYLGSGRYFTNALT